jgi:peroxiredoxin
MPNGQHADQRTGTECEHRGRPESDTKVQSEIDLRVSIFEHADRHQARRASAAHEREPAMRADIVPEAIFPDYELPDQRGKHRRLSELQGGDPLVLVLSRGGFCPKERRQHEGLLQLRREMQVGYCRLVTISTDNLLETNEFRAGVGADWTFLSDPGRKLQKDLEIVEYTDPHHNPMIPHTLVLQPGLRVYKIYNGYWFFGRPTVEELRLDLREALRRCRPDWDIDSAAQRTAWSNGEQANFFPYGKSQAQLLAEQDCPLAERVEKS